MNKCARKVCKDIERINREDMLSRRAELKKINRLRGRPENEIAVQSDGIYNNSLYSGVGKTPFQPATQCSYVVAENITPKKQIIALENVNKLCSKHGFHSSEDYQCNILSGGCSSTVPIETNIGNEKEWAKNCFLDLKSDSLEVKYLTTDPDSSAYRAALELKTAQITKTTPEHQIDTRHLGENHRKYIKRKAAVLEIMPGLTKGYKQTMRNRFSTDLSMRCKTEFENVHQTVQGNFVRLKTRIAKVKEAMIKCYAGDHTLCSSHSTACKGLDDNNWLSNSTFLPRTFRINVCNITHKKTFDECVNYRFGHKMLQNTKLNTNTQKVESVNQIIRRSLPKNITFPRCFPGRAHSAIFAANNGPGESLVRLCEETGCPITSNSRVAAALLTEQKNSEKGKDRAKSRTRKLKRNLKRAKLYEIYEKHHEEVNYQKGLLLRQAGQRRKLQNRARTFIRYEHAYSVRQHRKKLLRQNNIQGGSCAIVHTPAFRQ
ncbi:MAG: hypothetical protein KZQ70_14055 [gamma proteobacterium symbiont of Lucinoma myriamae]|nr:hypothetical protein [gamma proteobacterium symbiont of Lucinoma myriamae]